MPRRSRKSLNANARRAIARKKAAGTYLPPKEYEKKAPALHQAEQQKVHQLGQEQRAAAQAVKRAEAAKAPVPGDLLTDPRFKPGGEYYQDIQNPTVAQNADPSMDRDLLRYIFFSGQDVRQNFSQVHRFTRDNFIFMGNALKYGWEVADSFSNLDYKYIHAQAEAISNPTIFRYREPYIKKWQKLSGGELQEWTKRLERYRKMARQVVVSILGERNEDEEEDEEPTSDSAGESDEDMPDEEDDDEMEGMEYEAEAAKPQEGKGKGKETALDDEIVASLRNMDVDETLKFREDFKGNPSDERALEIKKLAKAHKKAKKRSQPFLEEGDTESD